ncbi:phosphonoacetaldehyde hydrolase [Peptoniphilus equinus]|uniref:Phosphonoacetaldehyde hydrolase n=1 Tax=Peptoniphilus equinus TaxID=3016343 RepID=A0ABY7QU49_9FIRM|nr:phosphonoacetaldehyde hydrolase [Peptoniphilus equinus]WBW49891.1 phosphonoacetaldehyde hydrolase [Peptoniphilus equinus]
MGHIEAVILDWAGTTVDYGCFAPVQAFVEAFEQYGITPTLDEVRQPMGLLKIDHIRTMLGMDRIQQCFEAVYHRASDDDDVKAIYKVMEQKTLDILKNFVDIKPHVRETVARLRAQGIKIGSTTGYTDAMMVIVAKEAEAKGYAPDFWATPNSVGDKGRPYPYMIFKNMTALGVTSVANVIKVGDTVSDIREGKAAGVITVGVVEGSSTMGLRQDEYDNLSDEEKHRAQKRVADIYKKEGADYVINDLRGLLDIIGK